MLASLDAAAAAAPSAPGTEARDARAALIRIEALRRTGDAQAARRTADEAIARLDAAGLADHPYRTRLATSRPEAASAR